MVKVVIAIIYYKGKILCCQRKKSDKLPNKWEFPGGKVKEHEKLRNALARELKEELDMKDILRVEQFDEFESSYGLDRYKIYAFIVEAPSYVVNLKVHEKCQWKLPSEINQLDWLEGNKDLISKLIKYNFSSR